MKWKITRRFFKKKNFKRTFFLLILRSDPTWIPRRMLTYFDLTGQPSMNLIRFSYDPSEKVVTLEDLSFDESGKPTFSGERTIAAPDMENRLNDQFTPIVMDENLVKCD